MSACHLSGLVWLLLRSSTNRYSVGSSILCAVLVAEQQILSKCPVLPCLRHLRHLITGSADDYGVEYDHTKHIVAEALDLMT